MQLLPYVKNVCVCSPLCIVPHASVHTQKSCSQRENKFPNYIFVFLVNDNLHMVCVCRCSHFHRSHGFEHPKNQLNVRSTTMNLPSFVCETLNRYKSFPSMLPSGGETTTQRKGKNGQKNIIIAHVNENEYYTIDCIVCLIDRLTNKQFDADVFSASCFLQ